MDLQAHQAPASGGTLDTRASARRALDRAVDHLATLQQERGCWVGEVKWCTILLSQYVIVRHLTGRPIPPEEREPYVRYFRRWEVPGGGWGLHPESRAYVFATALGYVALRLLGLSPDDEMPARARRWLTAHGGVLHIPSWGKLWLALLNLYGWEGVNPVPPELWLLPTWAPTHPRRMYNHTRLIYLGMGYLYGRRFAGPVTPIIEELRRELYPIPYGNIDFAAYRHAIAPTDLYVAPTRLLRTIYDGLYTYERRPSRKLRQMALDRCYKHILFELRATQYACVSPVNGFLNLLAVWDRDPHGEDFQRTVEALEVWRWKDEEEGIRYCGAFSHIWDTSFILQALADGPADVRGRIAPAVRRAYGFLREVQMKEEIPYRELWFRDQRLGGFCFSDDYHRWPVSDCTAEALTALLHIAPEVPAAERVSDEMLRHAATFVLARQNDDGGFGSYERNRGTLALERLNPSEMFGNCMVELSYVECSASCTAALARFRRHYPDVLRVEIDRAVEQGVAFLLRSQRPDGSWEGLWGVNFTYAILFAIEGLRAAGVPAAHPAIQRACRWLIDHQMADGGWGEHYTSCERHEYVPHAQSQVIMTAWALSALLSAEYPAEEAIERGVRLLVSRQLPNGDFPQEAVAGVFFHSAMLHYDLYKNYFPIWALGRYLHRRHTH